MQFNEILQHEEKRHNTATTSRESFRDLLQDNRLIAEKRLVYEAILTNGPITSRGISKLIERERSSVCRSIYDLEHEMKPAIKVAYIAKCPVTNKKVKWYSVIEWQGEATA